MDKKKRDTYVDFLRGFAMLLVVLGHTMTGSTVDSQSSLIFNIVWSLQMPLFIVISGYVTRYSRIPSDFKGLLRMIGKRTLAYLLPWFVFGVLFKGLVLHKQELTVDALFWHVDSGYWFLITIWFISVIYLVSAFFAEKLCRRKAIIPFVTLCFYLVGMAMLGGLGYFAGFDFLCIKLTLYYMPFYFMGSLFGLYQAKITGRYPKLIQAVVALCAVVWIIAIIKLELFSLSDTRIIDILLRAGTSICGCIAVCGLFRAVSESSVVYRFINWFGKHTLEVFLLHYFVLNLVRLAEKPVFASAKGLALTAANFTVTVIAVSVMILLLTHNRYINLILFGKSLKKTELERGK